MTTKEVFKDFTKEEGLKILNDKQDSKSVYNFFVSKGLTDSYETFVLEAKKIISETLSKMNSKEILAQLEGTELSEKQLEQIAGGKGDRVGSDDPGYAKQQGKLIEEFSYALCAFI